MREVMIVCRLKIDDSIRSDQYITDSLSDIEKMIRGLFKNPSGHFFEAACVESGQVPDTHIDAITVEYDPCDESMAAWHNDIKFNMTTEQLALLSQNGIATSVTVNYPRGDKYGVPFESTEFGGILHTAIDFIISDGFEVHGHDTEDDSGTTTQWNISVTPEFKASFLKMLSEG